MGISEFLAQKKAKFFSFRLLIGHIRFSTARTSEVRYFPAYGFAYAAGDGDGDHSFYVALASLHEAAGT
ncbi:hypothetical protein DW074_10370 [Ruminococcus sp. AF46-10NS]|mgnify:CR=1 FL=1|nr:hypothetical protein DW074_10370 [Ruminococcus sp. AF46-10NS]